MLQKLTTILILTCIHSIILCQMNFNQLSSEDTGLEFVNTIEENDSVNFFNFEYIYNGSGVAAGDFDNDGLIDLYFTGNSVGDALYINQGNLSFKNKTKNLPKTSQIGWSTGVTTVDINNDGLLDIYVTKSGTYEMRSDYTNQLYVNQGKGKFKEESTKYGLNISSQAVQSLFFDFDQDGDLDLFIINHQRNKKQLNPKYSIGEIIKKQTNLLYRNDNNFFVNISKEAGINTINHSLGIVCEDFNNDNWPDLYITNDYQAKDQLLINQQDGTFKDEILERMNQIPLYSMGVDAGDIDNDGFTEVLAVDMAATNHYRNKTNMPGMNQELFNVMVNSGQHHQYMFNALQQNNQNGTFGNIALQAGVSNSEWSWGTLFQDFDNDGKKDIFIANGYLKDVRNNDLLNNENAQEIIDNPLKVLASYPSSKHPNHIYQNKDGMHFEQKNVDWNMNEPLHTFGAVYADLDNDGDQDLILANTNDHNMIYENQANNEHNYISIKLESKDNNNLVGSKVYLYANQEVLYNYYQPTRSFQSSVSHRLHFGLGKNTSLDSLIIITPKGNRIKYNVNLLSINQQNKVVVSEYQAKVIAKKTFQLLTKKESLGLTKDQYYDDFKDEILLPNQMSQLGPFSAKGDVNADGLEDLFTGGAKGEKGLLYLQTKNGFKLSKNVCWDNAMVSEDINALFFDFDNDNDLDLYVVRGSNEFGDNSTRLKDNLYLNDGKGTFTETKNILPELNISGQAIAASDIDNDGDIDLFIGSRQTPKKYPFPESSHLLINENGKYLVKTEQNAPYFNQLGMITDAIFTDFDNDGDEDLITVGEWTGIDIHININGKFTRSKEVSQLNKITGWYQSIKAVDFNNDGIEEYLIGNIGENNKFHPSNKKPFKIYANDFDENGSCDIVLSKYEGDVLYPVRGRECSSQQVNSISDKFETFNAFASAPLIDIYTEEKLDSSLNYQAVNFEHVLLYKEGAEWKLKPLPKELQKAPINAFEISDFNQDGLPDFICVGNKFEAEIETPRYDAGRGEIVLNLGELEFKTLPPSTTGLNERGNARDVKILNNFIIVTNNNGPINLYQINKPYNK